MLAEWIAIACSNTSQRGSGNSTNENSKIQVGRIHKIFIFCLFQSLIFIFVFPFYLPAQLIRYAGVLLSQIDNYKTMLESLVGCNADDMSKVYFELNDVEVSLRRNIIN